LALGAAFLRAVRFSFLRSSLSSTLVVSATYNLFHCNLFWFSRNSGRYVFKDSREFKWTKAAFPASIERFKRNQARQFPVSSVQSH
jgi:hypothetical protein